MVSPSPASRRGAWRAGRRFRRSRTSGSTKEYNSSAIFAKILKRRGYASGFTATFPFEGNTGRILDRGDATTKDINVTQQEISFETENDKEYTPF